VYTVGVEQRWIGEGDGGHAELSDDHGQTSRMILRGGFYDTAQRPVYRDEPAEVSLPWKTVRENG
jgi:hypothetical protein